MISNIRNCDVTLMPFFSIDMFHRIVPQYSILDSFSQKVNIIFLGSKSISLILKIKTNRPNCRSIDLRCIILHR